MRPSTRGFLLGLAASILLVLALMTRTFDWLDGAAIILGVSLLGYVGGLLAEAAARLHDEQHKLDRAPWGRVDPPPPFRIVDDEEAGS